MTDFITSLLKALAWSATFAAMFAGALRLGPGRLRQVRARAGLFARTMVGVWILVPVFTRGATITPFEWWLARWRGGPNARRFVRRQERPA